MASERIRVVVTGVGAITPLGLSAEETWRNLVNGKSGVTAGISFDATDYPVKIAAEVHNFNLGDFISFKEARRMARFSQLAVGAAREALVNAGFLDDVLTEEDRHVMNVDQERIGVVLGTCAGGMVEIRDATQTVLEQGYRKVGPMFVPRMMHNSAAANIAHQFGIMGYNSTASTACAAGTQALGDAASVIRQGRADVMVTGGTESALSDVGQAGFWSTRAMTTRYNDDPTRASRPFDLNRDGIVIAEGAACLVLERLEFAQSRGATILAEILGFGCSGDAYHLTAPHPDGDGEVRSMKWALEEAEVAPEDIDYISAHATSTPIGDKIETLAIKRVFGENAYNIPVSSAKSMIGHAVAAAGAIEAIASVFTIRDNTLHPTINYETPDPECDLDYVPNIARDARVDCVLSNSFGMGGQNAAVVIGRI